MSDFIGVGVNPIASAPDNGSPPQPDYSAALVIASNNSRMTAEAQIMGQEFALQQSSMDHELKHAADTELGLEKLDTGLQTSLLEFKKQMTAEENGHIEKLYAADHANFSNLTQSGYDTHPDLPPPNTNDLFGTKEKVV